MGSYSSQPPQPQINLNDLNSLSQTTFQSLSATQISQISTSALQSLDQSHYQWLTGGQLAAMSGQQIAALIHADWLSPSAVAYMTSQQVAYVSISWVWMSADFLNAMSKQAFEAISMTQFQQITPASLAGLDITHIQWLTVGQIQAIAYYYFGYLSAAQVAAMSKIQLSVQLVDGSSVLSHLTSNQIAAVAVANLAPAQVRALTASQVQGLTKAQLLGSDAQGNQILSELSAMQISALTPTALDNTVLGRMGAGQIGALTMGQLLAPTANGSRLLSIVTPAMMQFLSVKALTATMVESLTGSQVAALSIGQLTSQDANGKTLLSDLLPSQVSALRMNQFSTQQIQILSPAQVGGLTAPQLNSLDGSGNKILSDLLPSQVGGLSIGLLTTAQVQGLTSDQITGLTNAQLAAKDANGSLVATDLQLPDLTKLSSAQIGQLSARQVSMLGASQLRQIDANGHAVLSDLLPAQIRYLSIPRMTFAQLQSLSAQQVAGLSTDQLNSQPSDGGGAALQWLVPWSQISGLPVSVLTSTQVQSLLPSQTQGLTSAQLAAHDLEGNTILSDLTAQQVYGLFMPHLSKAQVQSLNLQQVSGLNGSQLSYSDADGNKSLSDLLPWQVGGLSMGNFFSAQVQSLSANQAAALTAAQLNASTIDGKVVLSLLSSSQIGALLPQNIAGIQLNTLSGNQLAGLSPAQLERFSAAQIAGLTANNLRSLSLLQIAALDKSALNVQQLTALTSQQVAWLGVSRQKTQGDLLSALTDLRTAFGTWVSGVGYEDPHPTPNDNYLKLTLQDMESLSSMISPDWSSRIMTMLSGSAAMIAQPASFSDYENGYFLAHLGESYATAQNNAQWSSNGEIQANGQSANSRIFYATVADATASYQNVTRERSALAGDVVISSNIQNYNNDARQLYFAADSGYASTLSLLAQNEFAALTGSTDFMASTATQSSGQGPAVNGAAFTVPPDLAATLASTITSLNLSPNSVRFQYLVQTLALIGQLAVLCKALDASSADAAFLKSAFSGSILSLNTNAPSGSGWQLLSNPWSDPQIAGALAQEINTTLFGQGGGVLPNALEPALSSVMTAVEQAAADPVAAQKLFGGINVYKSGTSISFAFSENFATDLLAPTLADLLPAGQSVKATANALNSTQAGRLLGAIVTLCVQFPMSLQAAFSAAPGSDEDVAIATIVQQITSALQLPAKFLEEPRGSALVAADLATLYLQNRLSNSDIAVANSITKNAIRQVTGQSLAVATGQESTASFTIKSLDDFRKQAVSQTSFLVADLAWGALAITALISQGPDASTFKKASWGAQAVAAGAFFTGDLIDTIATGAKALKATVGLLGAAGGIVVGLDAYALSQDVQVFQGQGPGEGNTPANVVAVVGDVITLAADIALTVASMFVPPVALVAFALPSWANIKQAVTLKGVLDDDLSKGLNADAKIVQILYNAASVLSSPLLNLFTSQGMGLAWAGVNHSIDEAWYQEAFSERVKSEYKPGSSNGLAIDAALTGALAIASQAVLISSHRELSNYVDPGNSVTNPWHSNVNGQNVFDGYYAYVANAKSASNDYVTGYYNEWSNPAAGSTQYQIQQNYVKLTDASVATPEAKYSSVISVVSENGVSAPMYVDVTALTGHNMIFVDAPNVTIRDGGSGVNSFVISSASALAGLQISCVAVSANSQINTVSFAQLHGALTIQLGAFINEDVIGNDANDIVNGVGLSQNEYYTYGGGVQTIHLGAGDNTVVAGISSNVFGGSGATAAFVDNSHADGYDGVEGFFDGGSNFANAGAPEKSISFAMLDSGVLVDFDPSRNLSYGANGNVVVGGGNITQLGAQYRYLLTSGLNAGAMGVFTEMNAIYGSGYGDQLYLTDNGGNQFTKIVEGGGANFVDLYGLTGGAATTLLLFTGGDNTVQIDSASNSRPVDVVASAGRAAVTLGANDQAAATVEFGSSFSQGVVDARAYSGTVTVAMNGGDNALLLGSSGNATVLVGATGDSTLYDNIYADSSRSASSTTILDFTAFQSNSLSVAEHSDHISLSGVMGKGEVTLNFYGSLQGVLVKEAGNNSGFYNLQDLVQTSLGVSTSNINSLVEKMSAYVSQEFASLTTGQPQSNAGMLPSSIALASQPGVFG